MRHGGKWKKKACELGAEAEMVALDKARMNLAQAKVAEGGGGCVPAASL